jgi:hypothetical protein
MMPLAGLAITAGALLSAGITAGPASAATTGCPATKAGVLVASNVSATHPTVGNKTTYTFTSLVNQNPSGGVPGLIKFCVYPTAPTSDPIGHTLDAQGDNGAKWVYAEVAATTSRSRGPAAPEQHRARRATHAIGTATWGANVPDSQTIVLHLSDPSMCASLYGAGTCRPVRQAEPAPGPGLHAR